MARYSYKCSTCSGTAEVAALISETPEVPRCPEHGEMVRDYRADVPVAAIANLRRERELGGAKAARDLFLPTAKDFAGPSDPDGQKGIRDWADRHQPRDGNTKPLWPDMQKQVY